MSWNGPQPHDGPVTRREPAGLRDGSYHGSVPGEPRSGRAPAAADSASGSRTTALPAWLAQLYFVNDLTNGKRKATPKATWLEAFDDERAALGLTGRDVPNLAHITLEAGTRDELLAPPKA